MTEPLERVVTLRCSVQHAFEVFCQRIDTWWPKAHRKFPSSTLSLEQHVGGEFIERSERGETQTLGQVLACEPPHLIRYTWVPGSMTGPTEVEIRFRAAGDETVVEVTHREGSGADAFPLRIEIFTRSWAHVLAAFVAAVEAPRSEPAAVEAGTPEPFKPTP